MKDQIIGAYLNDFKEQFGLTDVEDAPAFEQFINYCVVSKYHPDRLDVGDLSVGGSGDLGLDGVAIIVNDHLVSDKTSLAYLTKQLRRLEVQFIFVQSKTSNHFVGSEIGNFISGVRQFFDRLLPSSANDDVRKLHSVKEYVYKSSVHMEHSPELHLHYATLGSWNEDMLLRSRIDQGVQDLRKTDLFSSVDFTILDSDSIRKAYRELNNKVVREIVFDKHTILPSISGVQEAYIGILPCLEYLKLLSDNSGGLNRRLFYDNVRDFQGHNPVNTEVRETVQNTEHSDRFALLNNGVTVVARDIKKVGAKFRLEDYQIVNGCQTSHVLYLNREFLNEHIHLPIKLIVTDDNEVTNQIIQGTNSQTEVKPEAFESLSPFQKQLEEFYLALGRDRASPLHYERRSKQYEHQPGVNRQRVITLASQIKCFVAMFLNEPHSTHRYYGELLTSYRERLFNEFSSISPLLYGSGNAGCGRAVFFSRGTSKISQADEVSIADGVPTPK